MDKYDKAIAYLTEKPEEIRAAWSQPSLHPAGCLFQSAYPLYDYNPMKYGCLTMVKKGTHIAANDVLTTMIREDARIPNIQQDITVEHLRPVFAEWQRLLDETIRKPQEVSDGHPQCVAAETVDEASRHGTDGGERDGAAEGHVRCAMGAEDAWREPWAIRQK